MSEKIDYYSLGKSLYETSWKRARDAGEVLDMVENTAFGSGLSRAAVYRALGYYRLFVKGLGFGRDVYALGPAVLDKLRGQIDWDHRTGEVGTGLGKKLGRAEARKLIKRMLEEHSGVAA